MLGQTATLTVDGVDKVLKLINQDGYSSEYRLKDSDRGHVLLIRHTKEQQKSRGLSVDRHNVLYRQEIYPTELAPQGEVIEAYTVIRVSPQQPAPASVNISEALNAFVDTNATAIVGWES